MDVARAIPRWRRPPPALVVRPDTCSTLSTTIRRAILLRFCLFLGGFIAVVAYFNFVDVYNNHYLQRGLGSIYNAFRVVFIAYLFWLIYFAGHRLLVFVAGDRPVAGIQLHERLALGFFVGAAALTIAMLVLGYALLVLAFRRGADRCIDHCRLLSRLRARSAEARASVARYIRDSSTARTALTIAMAIGVIGCGAILLLVKGLYPQGGHDYYLHYSQFYSMVIDSHGIWPNAFWYQYYYSKGVGLMFLSMLLTDPLAPSLVTYCFVIATALALYSPDTAHLSADPVAVGSGHPVSGARRAYRGNGHLRGQWRLGTLPEGARDQYALFDRDPLAEYQHGAFG